MWVIVGVIIVSTCILSAAYVMYQSLTYKTNRIKQEVDTIQESTTKKLVEDISDVQEITIKKDWWGEIREITVKRKQ